MSSSEIPDDWTEIGHRYIGGEWVLAYSTPDGRTVDASGDAIPPDSEFTPERYVQTVVVEGERFHEREATDGSGTSTWYDDAGEAVGAIDLADNEPFDPPGTIYVHDGELYRTIPTAGGTDVVLDADRNEATVSPQELTDELSLPEVTGFVRYGDRHAVVAVDAEGDRQLLTLRGEPVDGPIPWADLEPLDVGSPIGEPIAIGDYAMNGGGVERVYLFPSGAQAIRHDDGSYEHVIVPTDVEYPRGHAYFEGAFPTGVDPSTSAPFEVFSYPDGSTAIRLPGDDELILVDLPIETTHPGEAPVACGTYPGGELYVFPDGTQLIHRADGTWAPGQLPDIPPYDVLVERYGDSEPDAIDDALGTLPNVPTFDTPLPADPGDLFDDITTAPTVPGVEEMTSETQSTPPSATDSTGSDPATAPNDVALLDSALSPLDPLPDVDLDLGAPAGSADPFEDTGGEEEMYLTDDGDAGG